jgi:hypothetical protein
MQRGIRPSTPADAPAIATLLEQSGLQSNLEQQHFYWKYWQPRADWPGARSFVLVDGDQPIAHAAIIPALYLFGTRREPLLHMIDWAASRGEIGAGVALMKYLIKNVGSLLSIGGSAETLKILPHAGFRATGHATAYVRTLFPLRLLQGAERNWRLLPRVARSLAWTLTAPSPNRLKWTVRSVPRAQLHCLDAVMPRASVDLAVLGRSVDLFDYVLTCPIVPMTLFAVESAGYVRGYFLLASAPGQVRIADCWVASQGVSDWRWMLLSAVQQASKDPQAAEVVMWCSDPLLEAALHTCGFHARSHTPVQVRAATNVSLPAAPLRVQMLDADNAYLYSRHHELWA